jgi:hypothetical protein
MRSFAAAVLAITAACGPNEETGSVSWDPSTICRLDDSVQVQVSNTTPQTAHAGLSVGHAPAKEEQVPGDVALTLTAVWTPCDPKVAVDLVVDGQVVSSTLVDRAVTPTCE